MILDRLFKQYKKGAPKPCFGSRFASFVAKLTIGTTRHRSLDGVLPELQSTYYYRPADRFIPTTNLDKWEEDQKFVAEMRPAEEPVVAKAAALAAILACLVLVGAASGWTQVTCSFYDDQYEAQRESIFSFTPEQRADFQDLSESRRTCVARGFKTQEQKKAEEAAEKAKQENNQ